MTNRTTIHESDNSAGELHVVYDAKDYPELVYLHLSAGGFSFCTSLCQNKARRMAEALLKGAYAIEAHIERNPVAEPA